MSGHGIDVCRCGAVLAQCRCPGPHKPRVVAETCRACLPAAPPDPLAAMDAAAAEVLADMEAAQAADADGLALALARLTAERDAARAEVVRLAPAVEALREETIRLAEERDRAKRGAR